MFHIVEPVCQLASEPARRLLSGPDRLRLEAMARWRRRPPLALRARIVLASRDPKLSQKTIAHQLKTSRRTVRVWIKQFESGGMAALMVEKAGRGRASNQQQLCRKIAEEIVKWETAQEVEREDVLGMPRFDTPRLSQRQLARQMKVPLATLNRTLLREGWRLRHGYIKRQELADDPMLVGLFLDPPFKMIVVRRPASAYWGDLRSNPTASADNHRKPDLRSLLLQHTQELVKLISSLETRLMEAPKTAGRLESLSRLLRNLANTGPLAETNAPFEIYLSQAGAPEIALLNQYPQFPRQVQAEGEYAAWLAAALTRSDLFLKTGLVLVREFSDFHRLLCRRTRQAEQRKRGLIRPFQLLAKRRPAGLSHYLGDSLRAGETNLGSDKPVALEPKINGDDGDDMDDKPF